MTIYSRGKKCGSLMCSCWSKIGDCEAAGSILQQHIRQEPFGGNREQLGQECENQNLSEEIHSIRMQIWKTSDDMPMTRRQREDIETIKNRLFKLAESLKSKPKSG